MAAKTPVLWREVLFFRTQAKGEDSLASEVLRIVGAGPSGLAAAIAGALAGRKVIVAERRATVGARFKGDFQGLENWSSHDDILEELHSAGIATTFEAKPVFEQVCFGPNGREHLFQSRKPFYYLIRRGPAPGTLDTALLQQALSLGVEVRFGQTIRTPSPGSVSAGGPRRSDVFALGTLFETNLADGSYACLGDWFAPGGYGYLLANAGRATLACCIFRDFRHAEQYLERTVSFFQSRLSFTMRNVKRFGGFGNAFFSPPAEADPMLRIGEASGAQDALWGFGIRLAMKAGILAARHGANSDAYRQAWNLQLGRVIRASFVNRFCFESIGDLAYRLLLWRLAHCREPWSVLHQLYAPAAWKLTIFPVIRRLQARSSRLSERPQPDLHYSELGATDRG